MSVSREEEDPAREIFYVNFNQSSTALCVGARSGFNVYDLEAVYECQPTYESREDPEYRTNADSNKYQPPLKDICIIERNFQTALIAYVKLEKPRCVFFYNYKLGALITHRAFPNTILSVKLNRHNIVVCLEEQIFIMENMALIENNVHTITDTAPNLKGLIALSYAPQHDTSLLAYPGSEGHVQIFDAYTKHAKIMIPAHTSQLAALAFDEEATKLATASVKGTVMRVFSVATGDKLFEFQRGLKRCADIHCLSFYKNPELLLASSNTETIHIFKLCTAETIEPARGGDEPEGWMEMFGRVLYTQSTHYLPTQVTETLSKPRSFAHIHLPFVGQKTVCTITHIQNVPYVMVASVEGYLYIYDINMETGGACHLVKQHRIEGPCQAGFLNWANSLKDTSQSREHLPSSLGADPTVCLQPQLANDKPQPNVKPHPEGSDSAAFLSCLTEESLPQNDAKAPVVNGVQSPGEELPPLVTLVEQ